MREINDIRATTGAKNLPLPHEFTEISPDLSVNEKFLRQLFTNTTDIVFREFYMGEIRCLAVWVDGLTNNRISFDLFHSLMLDVNHKQVKRIPGREMADYVNKHFLPFYATIRLVDLSEAARWVMMQKTVLLFDGSTVGLVLDAENTPMRSITEPVNESAVSGPRNAFVESLRMNTAMIRAFLGDHRLKSENYVLGRRSNTLVTLMFIDDLANPEIIQEVRRRLSRIDIDALFDSNYLKEIIQDRSYPLVPLMKVTERPDKVVADLLEGKFALIVDGSPQVLTAPSIFVEFIQSAEDYYLNPVLISLIRLLRFLALFLATILPGFFVAIITFHQEMIPIPLIFSIAGTRETVPLPAAVEALFFLIIFELLVEAGIRLPRMVGAAVNIVGALIIGQAAVQANIVSPMLVIVVALTAISTFALSTTYQLNSMLRTFRYLYLAGGASLGLYGITLMFLVIVIYMTSLRSFGIPYMSPLIPLREGDWKDVLYRAATPERKYRPDSIPSGDSKRSDTPAPGIFGSSGGNGGGT